jgi:aspartate/methionine/tyrosine aminotransferase
VKTGNAILSSYGTTVFEVMSGLAREHGAINLGQGFPDGNGPADVVAAACDYLQNGGNQYPPMMGMPDLRQAVAESNRRFYGLDVDWQTEVMVTSGGTEALASSLFGLIEPGDEVVLIEPLYDSYLPIVRRAGGVAKLVRLEPPDWRLPQQALAEAFSDRTKLILLNSPMNPCSKVFSVDELALVAGLLRKHDALAVCDEVDEHLLPPNLQAAVAYGLRKDDGYFHGLATELEAKRDYLGTGLAAIGFEVLPCEGTYFITTDFRPLGFNGADVDFCRHITTEARVAAVPVSAFYQGGGVEHFARFCFCKADESLETALGCLRAHFGHG